MRFLLLAGVLIVTLTAECRASVIFSDDFEAEATVPDPPAYIGNYDSFQYWDVIGSGGVDLVGPSSTLWPPRIDSQMVDLDGNSGSTLITKQSFSLLPGTYTLSFTLVSPASGQAPDTVNIELGTVFSDSYTFNNGDDTAINFTRTIVLAAGTTGKLSFTDFGADSGGAYLDDVSLEFTPAAVPEPSSMALLAVGVLGIAFRVIRRRRN